MSSRWYILSIALGLVSTLGSSAEVRGQGKDVEIQGQLKLGVHKLKLESASLYQIEVKAKGFTPNVTLQGGGFLQNTVDFIKERNTFRSLFMPAKNGDYTLVISPNIFGADVPEGLLDYSVSLKTMKLEEAPLLKKDDKITTDDPRYNQQFRKTHYKAYSIKLSKGKTYIIDMVRTGANNKLDPFLLLENPKMQIVAQDDDSGGFPNARIMYRALDEGEHRIIATGLADFNGLGDFTLTVRAVKDEK